MPKPSEALAKNIRVGRALRGMKQEDLALAMSRLGHGWTYTTVSQVESLRRRVSIDELTSLALVLGYTVPDLLLPPAGEFLDLSDGPAGRLTARGWLEGAFAWLLEWNSEGKPERRTIETQRERVQIEEGDLQ